MLNFLSHTFYLFFMTMNQSPVLTKNADNSCFKKSKIKKGSVELLQRVIPHSFYIKKAMVEEWQAG